MLPVITVCGILFKTVNCRGIFSEVKKMYNCFKHMTQLLFITLFVYSDMQRNTNLDLHKEITEMFLELSNVIIEAEQSLNKHLYLCTANRKKNHDG